MDWSVPRKRSHMRPDRGAAAPHAVIAAQLGQPVLGQYRCGKHGTPYRYATTGEARGACHVTATKGKSMQPHRYMLCERCGPSLAICLTHSPYYREADAYFREERA